MRRNAAPTRNESLRTGRARHGFSGRPVYVGRLVWNRLAYVKNPDTGKRVWRLNPEAEWIVKDVPRLRIVDQDLWDRVKARQQGLRKLPAFHEKQRPRMLLSYLLKCGSCGGGFSKISGKHYGCSTARNKGTCENRLGVLDGVKQDELEGLVLGALQSRLMDPALLAEFCEEYTSYRNKLRGEKNTQRGAKSWKPCWPVRRKSRSCCIRTCQPITGRKSRPWPKP
jgi:site-specific DNA recombinase